MPRPSKKAPVPPPRLYRLRIELEGITPLIWRSLWIGGEVTLHKLHHVIQAAMGWTDAHLHEFEIGGGSYGIPEIDSDFAPERPIIDERLILLDSALQGISSFRYWYDFGDDWWHLVTVEETRPIDEDENPPIFGMVEAGENACPPEDSGGIPGYQGFLDLTWCCNRPRASRGAVPIWWRRTSAGTYSSSSNRSAPQAGIR